MIKILTLDGTSLDLVPGAEFVLEYDNPMMEDDRIPVPFSTSIALLPSQRNCAALEYLPALKLEPGVKTLVATLEFDGIPFLRGTLTYDGIEDGRLNYTFAGRSLEDDWCVKLYDLKVATFDYQMAIGNSTPTDGLFFPPIIRKDYTGYYAQGNDTIGLEMEFDNQYPQAECIVKYCNFPGEAVGLATEGAYQKPIPAIRISKILEGRMSLSDDISYLANYMYILAIYGTGWFLTKSEVISSTPEAAEGLPDITLLDFVQNIAKIFCGAVFEDGGALSLKSLYEVFNKKAAADWTGKVSDVFTSDKEAANSYSFAYANTPDEDFDKSGALGRNYPNLAACLYNYFGIVYYSGTIYAPWSYTAKIESTGDYLSAQGIDLKTRVNLSSSEYKDTIQVISAHDIAWHNNPKMENIVGDSDEVDNSTDFNLVKCTPAVLTHKDSDSISGSQRGVNGFSQKFVMAPILEITNGQDAERGSDVYVGLSPDGVQLTDYRGLKTTPPSSHPTSASEIDQIGDVTLALSRYVATRFGSTPSLKPGWLFEQFHKPYYEWLAKDRQLLSCDVNLTAIDLQNFRMYNKMLIHGRAFFVKKLSVTFKAGAEGFECEADFLSV